MILLDEPTSNLDSLNEGIILKSPERIGRRENHCARIAQSVHDERRECGI